MSKGSNEITSEDIKNWLIMTIVISLFAVIASILYLNSQDFKRIMPGQEKFAWSIIKIGPLVMLGAIVLLNIKAICLYIWNLIVLGFKSLFSSIFNKPSTAIVQKASVDGKVPIRYTGEPFKEGLPPLKLLGDVKVVKENVDQAENMKKKLGNAFVQLELAELKVTGYEIGPTVTKFYLDLGNGKIRLANIKNTLDDIALKTGVHTISQSTSKGAVCLEITNAVKQMVIHREVLEEVRGEKLKELSIPVGRLANGPAFHFDIEKLPHILIAGAAGMGKSVTLNNVIVSLICLHSPDDLQFIMIDPKRVELSFYSSLPHLQMPICKGPEDGINALNYLVGEMERRYQVLEKMNIKKLPDIPVEKRPFPILVCIIDELADLIMVAGKDVETAIARIAQKGRAAGIHLVLATQRPDAEILTGLIRSNVPGRIGMRVSKAADSRIILDVEGAEKLAGQGEGYALIPGVDGIIRFQSSFIEDKKIEDVVNWWSKNYKGTSREKAKAIKEVSNKEKVDDQVEEPEEIERVEQEDTTKPEHILRRNICEGVIDNDEDTEIKLPTVREMADMLNVSTWCVTQIIEKLKTEGWINKVGEARYAKTVVTLSKEQARIWLSENE